MRNKHSIVIVSYNEGADLEATVALAIASDPPPYEIIIVDDCSDIPVMERMGSFKSAVRVFRTPSQIGPGPAKAYGAQQAQGDIIILLDGHMRMPVNWLGVIDAAADKYPNAIMCSVCRSFDMGKTPFIGCGAEFMRRPGKLLSLNWLNRGPSDTIDRCPCILGACYIIPRSIWHSLGGINPNFIGWGCEEQDLSLRAWIAGYEVRRINNLVIPHHFGIKRAMGENRMNTWHANYNTLVTLACLFEDGVFEKTYLPFARQLLAKKALTAFEENKVSIQSFRDAVQGSRQYTDEDLHGLCGFRIPTTHEQQQHFETWKNKKGETIAATAAATKLCTTSDSLRFPPLMTGYGSGHKPARINVVGLRRSGNHGLIRWIANHYKTAIHYNDMQDISQDLSKWPHVTRYGETTSERPEVEILSWEDYDPDILVPQLEGHTFILVRSFYNLMASRLNGSQKGLKGLDSQRAIIKWPLYARNYNLLYDQWLLKEYRVELEAFMGWDEETEDPIENIAFLGSSFPEVAFNYNTLIQRWSEMSDKNPVWQYILGLSEHRDLNLKLFQWTLTSQGRFQGRLTKMEVPSYAFAR